MERLGFLVQSDPPQGATGSENEFITVVSGLPRSGTSMVMQMLNAADYPCLTDGVRQADADNPHGYFEYEKVKRIRQDRTWLPEAKGKAVKIIAQLIPFFCLPNSAIELSSWSATSTKCSPLSGRCFSVKGKAVATCPTRSLGKIFERQICDVKRGTDST